MTRSLHRLVAAVTILASLLANVHAISIVIPDYMIADETFEAHINPRWEDRPDLVAKYPSYRVFLSTEPPGWGVGTACWLSREESMETRLINVTVPAHAAPEGAKLRISAGPVQKGANRVAWYDYSVKRTFQGGNGTWSQAELNGRQLANDNLLSCQALACARGCSDKYWDGTRSGEDAADPCIHQCAEDLNPSGPAGAVMIPVTGVLISSMAIALVNVLY